MLNKINFVQHLAETKIFPTKHANLLRTLFHGLLQTLQRSLASHQPHPATALYHHIPLPHSFDQEEFPALPGTTATINNNNH